MRTVVVGLGNQGRKRRQVAGDEAVATVDPFRDDAQYQHETLVVRKVVLADPYRQPTKNVVVRRCQELGNGESDKTPGLQA